MSTQWNIYNHLWYLSVRKIKKAYLGNRLALFRYLILRHNVRYENRTKEHHRLYGE